MRKDMQKVMTEKGRTSGDYARPTKQEQIDGEPIAPGKESLRKAHKREGHAKRQRFNYAPLKRFIASKVGQPWDQVYAELAATFDVRSPLRGEAVDVALWGVSVKTSLKNGKVRVHDKYQGVIPLENAHEDYYVHPESRLLLKNQYRELARQREKAREAQRQAETAARRRDITETIQAHKIDGQWYAVELGPLAEDKVVEKLERLSPTSNRSIMRRQVVATQSVFDVVLNRHVSQADRHELFRLYGKAGVYGTQKRQLAYRELRALGLSASAGT